MLMQVRVVQHDPAWRGVFERESQRVLRALGTNARRAHHIGSTAIPAVPAKPIIDMVVEVERLEAVDAAARAMRELGYEAMGALGIAGRRYFRKDDAAGVRTHHVHVFAAGDAHVARHLAFRDFLNAHPDWASRYAELKRRLVAEHADSMEGYIAGKDGFIQDVDARAGVWARGRGEHRR